ncbi:MAG: type II toxin-antitoxin system RelE/ParE family toxin [Candidatus Diapherotrites archaeon]|nr:type II toxin-antitoxin system RelE/ParE family toxin [Candidatus Diapherotrites archaeon]
MTYKIIPTKEFAKDFKKIDKPFQLQIKKKIEEVSEDPERYKHLQYELKGSSRIRIGKLRIVFSYTTQLQELYLEKIIFDHNY